MFEQLWLRLWKGERGGLLSEKLLRQLRRHHSLDGETLKRLRYVSKPGMFAGRKTSYIRIYDPSLWNSSVQKVSRDTDLDNRPPVLLFEGRLNQGKFESTADYRQKNGEGIIA